MTVKIRAKKTITEREKMKVDKKAFMKLGARLTEIGLGAAIILHLVQFSTLIELTRKLEEKVEILRSETRVQEVLLKGKIRDLQVSLDLLGEWQDEAQGDLDELLERKMIEALGRSINFNVPSEETIYNMMMEMTESEGGKKLLEKHGIKKEVTE